MASPSDWPRRSAVVTGTASCLLGLAVLVAWSVHYVPLIQVSPALAPIQRITALGFLFCGLALILMSAERRRLAAMCAAPPLLIAALTILEYVFNADFGIDELLGKGYATALSPLPGRMSPVTALCFLLISSTLTTVAFRPLARYFSSILGLVGSVVLTVGTVSSVTYFIAQKDVYFWGHIARVALLARAGFLLLGAGLMAVGWKEKPHSSLLPNWLSLSAGLAVAVGVLGLWQAFVVHEESKFALLSWSLLVGGFIVALFFGLAVYLAQTTWSRNRQLLIYRMAFENSFDGFMLTSPDGAIHAANPSACRIFGRTEQEICQAGREGLIDTSDPNLQILMAERARTGKAQGELKGKRKDGTFFPMEVASVAFKDTDGEIRTSLALRDITARKHAEAELKIQTERLSLATRVASIGVWDFDVRTTSAIWDDILFEIYGIPRMVAVPYEDWARLVHPDDLPRTEASLQKTISLKSQDYVEFRIIRPDGVVRYISSAQGVVLDQQGTPIRVVGIEMDITERKRMEAQLAATARLSALGMMAGGVAHEINNPLAIIHASGSDLLDAAKEEGHVPVEVVVRAATRIRQTADRIARIVKSMRRIARDGSQDPFLSVHVSKIIEQTLEVCRAKFKDQSVTLRLPAIDSDLQIPCREVQISQVLLNLLTNALDAVVDQPGEKWVRMNVERRDESIVLSVVDSGPGVAPELKGRIMEPFFTTKEVGKGTGLGLSLSRTIAEEHGGKLEVTEDHGHTCFCLTLPVLERRKRHAA
jgi:PAS domain S-box-containing protein